MRQIALGSAMALGLVASVAGHGRQAASLPPPSRPVTWLVLVDDLHLDFRLTGQVRQVMKASFEALVRDGDRVFVRSSGPSTLTLDLSLTNPPFDRHRLTDAVKRTTGNALKPEDVTTLQARREVRYRGQVTADTLRQLVDAILPIEGATAVLLLSNGYPPGAMDLSALVEQAGRAGAAIYPVDPRPHPRDMNDPFAVVTRDSLRELANATGGSWQDDGETIDDYLTRVGAAIGR
jgi:hypothetical protein